MISQTRTLLVLAVLLVFLAPFLAASNNTIRVGVYDNSPKIYKDANGNITGFWAEIVNSIAADEGWDVQYVHGTFAEGLARLERNDIDVMVDVTYSDARAAKYDFTDENVLVEWSLVYVKAGSTIESPLDLQGKRIAVLNGSSNYVGSAGIKPVLSSFGVNATFIETGSYEEAFELVRRGDADAAVCNRFFGAEHAGSDLKETTILLSPGKSKFALTKNATRNPELIAKIDSRMRSMKADSQSAYYKASEKFLGSKTSIEILEVVPAWVFWAFGGLLVLVACALVAIYSLRESEQLYRSLIENSPIPMLTLDLNGRIKGANRAILVRTGYKLSEIAGKPFSGLIDKGSADIADAEFKRRIAGVPGRDVQIGMKSKSGLQKWFVIREERISKGGAVAVLVVFTDVTSKAAGGKRVLKSD